MFTDCVAIILYRLRHNVLLGDRDSVTICDCVTMHVSVICIVTQSHIVTICSRLHEDVCDCVTLSMSMCLLCEAGRKALICPEPCVTLSV